MNVFFTADNHFCHTNIIKYEDRPFKSVAEMNQYMIEKWNNKITNKDQIYILGDLSMDTKGYETEKILNQLNGQKFFIKGNHDYWIKKKWLCGKFGWIKDYYVLKHQNFKIILFHYPIAIWDCKHHDSIHLYGHIHSNKGNNHPLIHNLGKAYNVGVDVNNFEPVSFEEILMKLQ